MRIPALMILTIATALAAMPAWAQTYNPDYPACLQTFGIFGDAIECEYTSLAQCAPSARARAAQCIINPYFPGARQPANHRRHRHVKEEMKDFERKIFSGRRSIYAARFGTD